MTDILKVIDGALADHATLDRSFGAPDHVREALDGSNTALRWVEPDEDRVLWGLDAMRWAPESPAEWTVADQASIFSRAFADRLREVVG